MSASLILNPGSASIIWKIRMWYNPIMVWLLRSPLHGLVSENLLLVKYTGRKSGKPYAVPVNYVWDGNTLLSISFRKRTWWRNLRSSPLTLYLKGKEIHARAEVLEEPESVAQALVAAVAGSPAYQRFLNIHPDETGQPSQADALRAAQTRVAVRFYPQS